jgi:peptide/nickel transport system substrate-binding protein
VLHHAQEGSRDEPDGKDHGYVGSGPFIFNETETRQGVRYVYDRNPNYVPRAEPASGLAGGKVAKVDRVMFENMADSQTALAALQAGEIDFYETPPSISSASSRVTAISRSRY